MRAAVRFISRVINAVLTGRISILCVGVRNSHTNRAADSIEKLKGAGIFITLEDAKAFRADPASPLHTMHIARAAAEVSGKTAGEIYKELLAPGKIAHSVIGRPTPEEAVDCIHACGGIASVAHPGRIELPFEERERIILALTEYGADGIEAVYTTHTEEETEYFKGLAGRAGGAYHGRIGYAPGKRKLSDRGSALCSVGSAFKGVKDIRFL